MKYSTIMFAAAICAAGVLAPAATAAPTVTIKKGHTAALPEIWKNVSAAKRLQYVRAAELDATRILAERLFGISIDGETTVKDLAAANDSVKAAMMATLKGVKTVGKHTFHEDGRVEVVRAVKTRTLVETLTKSMGTGTESTAQKVLTEEFEALGNAAIPGSDGHARVMAKRAAELDAYRRLAERVAGVQITGNSTMRDFVIQSDELKATFGNMVKSAEITSITYLDDNSAEVTAKMKIGPLVQIITKKIAADGKILDTSETSKQLEIEVCGVGAPPTPGETPEPAVPAAPEATGPTTTEIDMMITEVLSTNTVL